jgi:hypothetical protein
MASIRRLANKTLNDPFDRNTEMKEQQHSQPNISTRKVHRTAVLFLPLLLANAAQADDVEPAAGPIAFRIEPQSLDRALMEFSAASGQQVVVDGKLSTGVYSPGVSGSYTPRQALDKLLEGTGIAARVNRNGTVTLEKAKAAEPQSMGGDLPKLTVSDTAEYDTDDPYNPDYIRLDSSPRPKRTPRSLKRRRPSASLLASRSKIARRGRRKKL